MAYDFFNLDKSKSMTPTTPSPTGTPSGHDFFSQMFRELYGLGQAAGDKAVGMMTPPPGPFGAGMGGVAGTPPTTAAPVSVAPAAPSAPNPFAALLAGLGSGGAGAAAASGTPPGPNLGALLTQLQQDKDPVGRYNNRSNLPSNAPGSLSPFATGFFKPKSGSSANAGAAAAGSALR